MKETSEPAQRPQNTPADVLVFSVVIFFAVICTTIAIWAPLELLFDSKAAPAALGLGLFSFPLGIIGGLISHAYFYSKNVRSKRAYQAAGFVCAVLISVGYGFLTSRFDPLTYLVIALQFHVGATIFWSGMVNRSA
jgi:sugar phosphate permease